LVNFIQSDSDSCPEIDFTSPVMPPIEQQTVSIIFNNYILENVCNLTFSLQSCFLYNFMCINASDHKSCVGMVTIL